MMLMFIENFFIIRCVRLYNNNSKAASYLEAALTLETEWIFLIVSG